MRTSEDDVLTPLQVIPFQDMEGEALGELCLFSVYSVFLYHRSYYFSLTFIFMKLVRGIGNYDMYNCKLVLCICIYIYLKVISELYVHVCLGFHEKELSKCYAVLSFKQAHILVLNIIKVVVILELSEWRSRKRDILIVRMLH